MSLTFKMPEFSIIIICGLLALTGCSGVSEKNPDVSNQKPRLHLIRFEQLLFALDSLNLNPGITQLEKSYPEFSSLFFDQILSENREGKLDSALRLNLVKEFITDSTIREIYHKTQKLFSGNEELEQLIYNSLQYFKYYFPEMEEPVFYTLVSGFAYGNFIFLDKEGKDGLGIGLEFFLGKEIDYKNLDPENPAFSDYLNRSFTLDHLLSKTWSAWIDDRLGEPQKPDLLNYIIQRGKKAYILEHLLPQAHDTVIFEYSNKQLEWCRNNTIEIWSYFMAQNLLYSNELLKINKYINPSPNSPGMPAEAPGRTGAYIGYEIVRSYMRNHPETSLADLLLNTNNQDLFKKAKFKPRND